jgi:hypothetical protein
MRSALGATFIVSAVGCPRSTATELPIGAAVVEPLDSLNPTGLSLSGPGRQRRAQTRRYRCLTGRRRQRGGLTTT